MKKTIKILLLTITALMFISICSCVCAATANIVADNEQIEIGESTKITASVTAGDWQLYIKGENVNETWVSSNAEEKGNVSDSKTYTFNPSSTGSYTFTLTGNITDYYDDEKSIDVNKSVTINVKEKEQTSIQPENPTEPEQPPTTDPEPEKPAEPTFTPTSKTMYVAVDALNLRESYSTNSTAKAQLEKGTKVTVIGILDNGWYKVQTPSGEGYVSAGNGYLTENEPKPDPKPPETEKPKTESSIATLSNLEVRPGNLNETFSTNNFSYSMTVESDVDSVEVIATRTDNKSTVTIENNTGLKTGTDNEIVIKVVAENGSMRRYTIKVTKLASEDDQPNIIEELKFGLSSLSIDKIKITPEFKNDLYEYTAKLTDMSVKSLKVNAVSTEEDAKVEITGADEIKDGENIITITVTSADGEQTATYKINVNKEEEKVVTPVAKVENDNNGNGKIILVVGAGAAILVLIVAFILIKRSEGVRPTKKRKDENYEEFDYDDEDDENEYEYEEDYKTSKEESINNSEEYEEKNDEQDEENYDEDDEDDDWGTPKRGFMNRFKKPGRHF